MTGLPLTASEIAAKLARQVSQLTALGVDPGRAAVEVASRYGIEPLFVVRIVAAAATADLPTTRSAA